jgi:ribonuclease P protein component
MTETLTNLDHTFKKKERLCSKNLIDELFQRGKYLNKGEIRLVYLIIKEKQQSNAQIMISVPKKTFKKSVDRNLLKRRMREAYRLNKTNLQTYLSEKNQCVLVAFLYVGQQIADFSTIQDNIIYLLDRLIKNFMGSD